MRIEIQAMETSLTPEEMKSLIPSEIRKNLKSGVLQAYILAQEGVSQPKVLGKGQRILKWPRAVIRQLADRVKAGTKFFLDHNSDNSVDGREALGEVVSSTLKDIGGKLSNIIIGHFPEAERVKDLDVCSMETNILTHERENDLVSDLEDVSGVALGSSIKDNPAFTGARRLATIQCFENQGGESKPGEGEKKKMEITFEDVKKAIKDMNIFPWQLFDEEQMRKDKVFGEMLAERDKLKSELTSTKENLEKTKKDSENAIKASQKATAKTRLKELLPDGLTEKQNQFIMDNFDPDKIEDLEDDGLKSYVESSQKEYSRLAKMFGVSENGKETENSGSQDNGDRDAIENDPVALAMKELTV